MHCPRCDTSSLLEIDRDGITIDRCERCRGVWLDRGELEKLIARAQGPDERAPGRPEDARRDRERERKHDDDDDDDRKRGRRGSWFADLFD